MHGNTVAVAGMVLITLTAAPRNATAYEDTGYDPDDRAVVGFDPDIASTTRRLWSQDRGRFLSVIVRAYEEFGFYWFIDARLDSRGGPRVDFTIRLFNADMEGAGCALFRRTGSRQVTDGNWRQTGHGTRCVVPIRHLQPTKEIRWKLISHSGYDEEESETEYAPNDRTWYS